MTSDDRVRARLQYIADSITRVQEHAQGERERFLSLPIVQDAIPRRLGTLADATHRLPDDLKAPHPEVPWREVYGFRHIAAHAYEFLDLGRVWEILEQHLPVLGSAIDAELALPGRRSPDDGDPVDD